MNAITGGIDEVGYKRINESEFLCLDPDSSRFIVYGLFDPRDGELRYIGKSCSGLKRANNHTKSSDLKRHGKTHKSAWIMFLLRLGLKPTFGVLRRCSSDKEAYLQEQKIISEFRALGARLTNSTDGGPGRFGYKLSKKTKAKLRKSAKAQQRRSPTKHTDETKKGLRTLQLGRKHSLVARANMSKAHGGKPFKEVSSGIEFQTQNQAATFFEISQSKIGMVLNGFRKSTGGRKFVYVE